MKTAIQVVIFVLVNLIGFYILPVMINLFIFWDILPDITAAGIQEQFKTYWFAGGMLCWFICALISLTYFFVKGKKRFAFLTAPIYGTILYGLFMVVYFNGLVQSAPAAL